MRFSFLKFDDFELKAALLSILVGKDGSCYISMCLALFYHLILLIYFSILHIYMLIHVPNDRRMEWRNKKKSPAGEGREDGVERGKLHSTMT